MLDLQGCDADHVLFVAASIMWRLSVGVALGRLADVWTLHAGVFVVQGVKVCLF